MAPPAPNLEDLREDGRAVWWEESQIFVPHVIA